MIPSLHTALFDKRYNDGFWASSTPSGLSAPLHESDYKEGGTLSYLLRIAGHEIFIMGTMNYVEREISGLRPEIAIIGAGPGRHEVYRYTSRLMKALGNPPVVFPTHWDDYGTKPRAEALQQVATFVTEAQAASPKTRVFVPNYLRRRRCESSISAARSGRVRNACFGRETDKLGRVCGGCANLWVTYYVDRDVGIGQCDLADAANAAG